MDFAWLKSVASTPVSDDADSPVSVTAPDRRL